MQTEYASVAVVQSLFGKFCVYWAQTTSRNAWLWFFLGWLFATITGIVLIYKNTRETPLENPPETS
jgi:cytochrome c-type biogenesis protein CcmH/NrfF